ncbi:MAG: MoaD/ThiS family protein [Oscillospiraceae bacterium]|nr:MoaD/ThiS family protein [Oscillospiraceae bacterium]
MAEVNIRYRGTLAGLINKEEERITAETVREVLAHIKTAYGAAAGKTAKSMLIVVDGESIHLRGGFATRLKEGETLQFLPICGGG